MNTDKRKIVITGLSGFLGTHAAAFFAAKNNVAEISNSVSQINSIHAYHYDALQKMDFEPEIIIHCHAAVASGNKTIDRQTLHDGNVIATQKIATRFPDAKHIYISTASIYDSTGKAITESGPANPISEYAQSKHAGEQIIFELNKANIIRLSSVYGIGMKEQTLIPNYVNQALQNNQIEVWGTGARRQNYIHVSDVMKLIDAVMEKDLWDQKIYLGTSVAENENIEIAELVAKETYAPVVFKNTDNSASVAYDNSFTRNSLNWQPEVSMSDGIKEYTTWKKRQS